MLALGLGKQVKYQLVWMEEKLCLSVRKAFQPKVTEYPTNDGLHNWGVY